MLKTIVHGMVAVVPRCVGYLPEQGDGQMTNTLLRSARSIVVNMARPCASLVVAALLALCCSEAAETPMPATPSPLDVVLVTWDTVRWDRVGANVDAPSPAAASPTPTFDRFADEGVLFTEARTTSPITLPAHASILTGLHPPGHGARDNGIFKVRATAPTLAEEFAKAGYATAAFVSAQVLNPRHGLDRGFERYDYYARIAENQRTVPERRGDKTVDAALAWLGSVPADRPIFLWVHLFDPHRMWEAPAPWSERYDPYGAEIAFTDAQTGRLLGHLGALGRLRHALVVITSDHGEGLGEHGERTHAYFAYDSTLRVPLLLWAGEKTGISLERGARVDGLVSLVDIAPTIRALCGLPDRPTDGRSLASQLSGAPLAERALPFESAAPAYAYATAPIFGVVTPEGEGWFDLPRRERYDLRRDPGQLENLYEREDDFAADALFARFPRDWPPTSDRLELDAASRERLASLGYVMGSPADVPVDSDVDPKDRVAVHELVARDRNLRHPRRLLPEVRALHAEHGPIPSLVRFEIELLDWHGRSRDALELVREAASANLDHPEFQKELRVRTAMQKELEVNIRRVRQALERDPDDAENRVALADLLVRNQEFEAAEVLYREILARDPDDHASAMNLANVLALHARDDEAIAQIRVLRSKPDYEVEYDCRSGDLLLFFLGRVEEGREALRACEARGGEINEARRAVLDGTFKGLADLSRRPPGR
jgi:arylsulfatase A-like enzyme